MVLDLTNYKNNDYTLNVMKLEDIDDNDIAKLFHSGYQNSIDDEGESIDDWKKLVSKFKGNEYGELIYEATLFIKNGNNLASGIIIGKEDNKPYIIAITTEPNNRNKGLASSLIKTCAIILKEKYKEFILYVNEENTKAIELYKKLGFKIVEK